MILRLLLAAYDPTCLSDVEKRRRLQKLAYYKVETNLCKAQLKTFFVETNFCSKVLFTELGNPKVLDVKSLYSKLRLLKSAILAGIWPYQAPIIC